MRLICEAKGIQRMLNKQGSRIQTIIEKETASSILHTTSFVTVTPAKPGRRRATNIARICFAGHRSSTWCVWHQDLACLLQAAWRKTLKMSPTSEPTRSGKRNWRLGKVHSVSRNTLRYSKSVGNPYGSRNSNRFTNVIAHSTHE